MTIVSYCDILSLFSAEDTDQAKRNLYKYTNCGAWITFEDDCIQIGSIVEGCDLGTHIYQLVYPFDDALFARCLAAIEKEADKLWHLANETDDDELYSDLDVEFVDLVPYMIGRSS